MKSIPLHIVADWLNKLIVSIIPPDRCRDAFRGSDRFSDPDFINRLTSLSETIDNLVLELLLMPGFPEMKKVLTETPRDVVDAFIARTFLKIFELEASPGEYLYEEKPDIRDAMRDFLIQSPDVRSRVEPVRQPRH